MVWSPFRRRQEATLTPEAQAALTSLVGNPKYELIPMKHAYEQAESLPPGAVVTVTASPTKGMEPTLDLVEWLTQRGFHVIPHFSARLIRDRAHLQDLMARATAAGVRKLFVVGGDGQPAGEVPDGLALLRMLHELSHPFEEIGVPAYPEGHAAIPDDVLLRTLKDKQQYAQAMTTQMSFNPDAVATWILKMRDEGITMPVSIGIPGVVEITKLMKIAARVGVGESARYLTKNRGLLGHLASPNSFGPDEFLRSMGSTLADARADVRGLHVFTFNEVAASVGWQQKMMQELGSLANT